MKQNVDESAHKLHEMKYAYPELLVSKRCLDFKVLEIVTGNYISGMTCKYHQTCQTGIYHCPPFCPGHFCFMNFDSLCRLLFKPL